MSPCVWLAPYVAGLAAYFRGLPDNPALGINLSAPADVMKLVRKMRRKVFLLMTKTWITASLTPTIATGVDACPRFGMAR